MSRRQRGEDAAHPFSTRAGRLPCRHAACQVDLKPHPFCAMGARFRAFNDEREILAPRSPPKIEWKQGLDFLCSTAGRPL